MAFMGTLASAQANGNSTAITAKGGWLYQVDIGGTFNGATVKIQKFAPAPVSEWIQVGDDITAAASTNVEIPSGTQVRINVASGGGSESINGAISLLRNR